MNRVLNRWEIFFLQPGQITQLLLEVFEMPIVISCVMPYAQKFRLPSKMDPMMESNLNSPPLIEGLLPLFAGSKAQFLKEVEINKGQQ